MKVEEDNQFELSDLAEDLEDQLVEVVLDNCTDNQIVEAADCNPDHTVVAVVVAAHSVVAAVVAVKDNCMKLEVAVVGSLAKLEVAVAVVASCYYTVDAVVFETMASVKPN